MNKILSVFVFSVIVCLAANAQKTPTTQPAKDAPKSTPQLLKHNMKKEVLLDKMQKAIDPDDKAKNWKTSVAMMQMEVPMQKLKMSLKQLSKYPDKTKIVAIMPGIPKVIQVFNGEKAWKETEGLGIQEKTGMQLAFAQFECKKANPALKPSEIYPKIVLDPYLYKIGKYTCYKLICDLPAKLQVKPSLIFIDNKKFLPRCTIENQLTDMGIVPVRMNLESYKSFYGVNTPSKVTMNMMGIQMKATLLSFKINQEIDDSEFKFPENK